LAGRGAPPVSNPARLEGCASIPMFASTASFFWSNSDFNGAHAG